MAENTAKLFEKPHWTHFPVRLPLLPLHTMQDSATQKSKYDAMVHLWPITVEMYPTGKVAFVARPGGRGKRWNKTFSTSSFGSPEEASRAAIEFCKRVQSGVDEDVNSLGKIREQKKVARYRVTNEEAILVFENKKLGVDVAGLLRVAFETKKFGIDPVELLRREVKPLIIAGIQAKWGSPK